jgi:hypothetical protein
MIFIEPIAFHYIYASIKGYWHFLRQKNKMGTQVRQGFNNANIENRKNIYCHIDLKLKIQAQKIDTDKLVKHIMN